jgi:hypothetical protein
MSWHTVSSVIPLLPPTLTTVIVGPLQAVRV